jgi:NTE family protein
MSKALVLSGGGSVGIAWEIGVAAGLARGGVDLRDADFIVGTSAGSAVGALLALGRDLEELVSWQGDIGRRPSDSRGSAAGEAAGQRMAQLFAVIAEATAGDRSPEAGRAEIGRFALEADSLPEDRYIARFYYVKGDPWPAQFACPAVDAVTGEAAVWDVQSGVDLDRAVASSCAVPGLFAPITINGRRYFDGGFRSGMNADLAKGHDRVLMISVFRAIGPGTQQMRNSLFGQLDSQIAALTETGSMVELIQANEASAGAIGLNVMDRSVIPAAVDAGIRQGEAEASRLRGFWSAG